VIKTQVTKLNEAEIVQTRELIYGLGFGKAKRTSTSVKRRNTKFWTQLRKKVLAKAKFDTDGRSCGPTVLDMENWTIRQRYLSRKRSC
jgi:hypothetical protein